MPGRSVGCGVEQSGIEPELVSGPFVGASDTLTFLPRMRLLAAMNAVPLVLTVAALLVLLHDYVKDSVILQVPFHSHST